MPADWSRTGGQPWKYSGDIRVDDYRCGYCSAEVGSNKGWTTDAQNAFIRICPLCNCPSFFGSDGLQWPGARVGSAIANVPPDIAAIHAEARASIAASAFTGAVMLCRKVLMHVAVEKGAEPGKSFQHYVEWLIGKHFVPTGSEGWLDYIRERGNDANHEIALMQREDAIGVLEFTEALLRNAYELPSAVPKPARQ